MSELFFLLIFIICAVAFAIASVVASYICGYNSEDIDKSPYECGMKLLAGAKIQPDVKFFNYAVMFLIFDVQAVFLFPFAVSLYNFKVYALVEMVIFTVLMLFTLLYAVKKKVLRWK